MLYIFGQELVMLTDGQSKDKGAVCLCANDAAFPRRPLLAVCV